MKTRILESLPWLQLYISPTWARDLKGHYSSFDYGLPGTVSRVLVGPHPPCADVAVSIVYKSKFYDAALSASKNLFVVHFSAILVD